MMTKLFSLILQGLIALLPLGLTLYFIYWLISLVDSWMQPLLPAALDVPGVGLVVVIAGLIGAGLLVNLYGFRWLLKSGNNALTRIPLVKSVFGMLQDMVTVFNLNRDSELKKVVSVTLPGNVQLIGFVTAEHSAKLLYPDSDKVGVYCPFSYQIGGYTLYVDRSQLSELDVSVEQAMRMALTAGAKAKPTDAAKAP